MSQLEAEELEEPEFKWGKKKGIGGKNKDVQFYESFTYEGVDYALYDCVYMHKEGEPEPYIGKLLKIWAYADKNNKFRKIKVQWFFQPSEITYYLQDAEVLENELFFASGAGTGLANVNPLEAIAGKCNVVCISTDSRNPQLSAEELQMADFVFYRIFDVSSCTISDQMDDRVGGLEVKFVFNRKKSEMTLDVPKLEWKKMAACKETPQQLNNVKSDENGIHMLKNGNTDVKQVQVEQESVLGETKRVSPDNESGPERKCSPGDDVKKSTKGKEAMDTTVDKSSALGGCKVNGESDKVKDIKSPVNQAQVEKRVKSARKSDNLVDTPLKRAKVAGNDAAHLVTGTTSSGKDFVGCEKDKKFGENTRPLIESPPTANVVSPNEIPKPSTTNVSPIEIPKSGCNKDFEGSGQAKNLVKNSTSALKKRSLKESVDLSKEKPKPGYDDGHENKDITLSKDSCPTEGRPKKANLDHSVNILEDNENNTIKKLKEKIGSSDAKNSQMLGNSHDDKMKSRLDKSLLKEGHTKKTTNLSTTSKDDVWKDEARIFEVSRRPIVEKNKWMKLPWEERMKAAHDQGKLVLLQNLDPEYTSGEVEDIIWYAFKENCTAKMLQHTAVSNPHSGQAFVVFNSREALDKIMDKLEHRCLILPNKRPLVISTGVSPKYGKPATFVGHLAIDKARRQVQRELMKEAVSTSHYSQNNTIEYEMAMTWCLVQSKSDKWWDLLYKQQKMELKKLTDNLNLE